MDWVHAEDGKFYEVIGGDMFFVSCCDCGLAHTVKLKSSAFGKIEVSFTKNEELTAEAREKLGKPKFLLISR